MPADTQQLDQKIEGLRNDVNRQMSGIQSELKQMTETMQEMVRLEGDQHRLWDAVQRIGKESDDHEHRIRTLTENLATINTHGAVSAKGVSVLERWLYAGGGALLSVMATLLMLKVA